MRNLLLFIFSFTLSTALAQFNFSDDFESYSEGDYIGTENTTWTTWSGTTGNSEDAQVTINNAASGSNSIYFTSSASTGGPQDVILPFGQVFDEGDFVFSANFFVENNTGSYFNFQAETTVGDTWAMDCYMNNDGTIVFSTGGGATTFISDTYPTDSWFNLEISINLTLNQWEVLIDGNSIGSFSNTVNQVASLDLFPLNGHSFYVDDVIVSHTPFTPTGIDAILLELDIPQYVSIPADVDIKGTILNYGAETITSMDIVWSDGVNSYTDNVTDLSIQTLETYDFIHPNQLSITTLVVTNLAVSIENVNGQMDIDESNNSLDASVTGVEFVTQRTPLYEHFTSNTCGPCASFNEEFQELLDENNVNQLSDAKVACIKYQVDWPSAGDQSYNADVGTRVSYYNVSGVPSPHIDGTQANGSQDEINGHRNEPSFLKINGTAVASEGTDLEVEVSVESYEDYPNASVHIAVVENQYTNYAGTNGETAFFQVVRKMLPDAEGTSANLSNGNSISINDSVSFEIGNVVANSFNLWEGLGNCVVVVFVQDESNKKVLDSKIIPITGDTEVSSDWDCIQQDCNMSNGEPLVKLVPNPATTYIALSSNAHYSNMAVGIYSIHGQKVMEKNPRDINAQQPLNLYIGSLQSGIYFLKVQVNKKAQVLRFIKQ